MSSYYGSDEPGPTERTAHECRIRLRQQRAVLAQVDTLIDAVAVEWADDDGWAAKGARQALAQVRHQITLRFGEVDATPDPEPRQPTAEQAERVERRAKEISEQLAGFVQPAPYEPRPQDGGER